MRGHSGGYGGAARAPTTLSYWGRSGLQHRRLKRRKRRPLSRASGIAVGGSGLRLLISEQLALGAANRRSRPPTSPPAASQGRSTVLHQPRSARTAAAKQLRTSHRGAAALLSTAAAAGQPGPRRALRPVSPGAAALAADVRGARRPADTLNELRPLRQRVSRAAGVCLPAAAGCQRSSARRCRPSAARCRRPGRRSSSPTTRHPRT